MIRSRRAEAWALLFLVAAVSFAPSTGRAAMAGDTTLSITGPITLIEGEPFWGGYVTLLHRITPEMSIGGDSGFQVWSRSSGTASATVWNIPILLTGLYHFEMPEAPTFQPFIGLGLGVGLLHGSLSSTVVSGSDTEAKFQTLAHVGAKFGGEGPGVVLDLRMGLLDSAFVFAPTLGYEF